MSTDEAALSRDQKNRISPHGHPRGYGYAEEVSATSSLEVGAAMEEKKWDKVPAGDEDGIELLPCQGGSSHAVGKFADANAGTVEKAAHLSTVSTHLGIMVDERPTPYTDLRSKARFVMAKEEEIGADASSVPSSSSDTGK